MRDATLPDRIEWARLASTGYARDQSKCASCWNTFDPHDEREAESDNEPGVCRLCCGDVYDEG